MIDTFLMAGTFVCALLQAILMGIDEVYFHRRRRLGLWEKIGHPLDALVYFVPLSMAAFLPWTHDRSFLYAFAATFSCFFITKDEWVHKELCEAAELWIHALLFILHPLILMGIGLLWGRGVGYPLRVALPLIAIGVGAYQAIYWLTKKESAHVARSE